MNQSAGRREFLKYAAAVTVGTGLLASSARPQGQGQGAKLLKACQFNMLPKDLKDAEKFALAKKCGFEGIEVNGPSRTWPPPRRLGALARQAGVPIHSAASAAGTPRSRTPSRRTSRKGSPAWRPRCAAPRPSGPTPCCWCRRSSPRRSATARPSPARRRTSASCCRWRRSCR